MKVLRITKAGPGKPHVWIEAGIHAREWIASAVATYLVDQLLNDPTSLSLVSNLNFHILPLANPDGYEYSRTWDRMWRKTRSRHSNSGCIGVDGNRNWDFHFNGTDQV